MPRGQNVVVYAVRDADAFKVLGADESLRRGVLTPLLSVDLDGMKNRGVSAARVMHSMTAEFSRAEREGRPHPEMIVVQESRDADPDTRQQRSASFVLLDGLTLSPVVQDDKGAASLGELFSNISAAAASASQKVRK